MDHPATRCCQSLRRSILGWSCAPRPQFTRAEPTPTGSPLSADGLDIDFIPSGLRRRCSTLSKVTLAVAYAAARGRADLKSLPSVFCSAHGESEITATLLQDLAAFQPLSPMGFSLSVHNAASGLFSIATGNVAPSTAIAASAQSCSMGLCEALLLAHEEPASPVLFVYSDDRVPAVFLPDSAENQAPFALAVLFGALGMPSGVDIDITIDQRMGVSSDCQGAADSAEDVGKLTAWLDDRTRSVELSVAGSSWCFDAAAPRATLFTSPYRA